MIFDSVIAENTRVPIGYVLSEIFFFNFSYVLNNNL